MTTARTRKATPAEPEHVVDLWSGQYGDSLTGFDEVAIAKAFGANLDTLAAKGGLEAVRALIFVHRLLLLAAMAYAAVRCSFDGVLGLATGTLSVHAALALLTVPLLLAAIITVFAATLLPPGLAAAISAEACSSSSPIACASASAKSGTLPPRTCSRSSRKPIASMVMPSDMPTCGIQNGTAIRPGLLSPNCSDSIVISQEFQAKYAPPSTPRAQHQISAQRLPPRPSRLISRFTRICEPVLKV